MYEVQAAEHLNATDRYVLLNIANLLKTKLLVDITLSLLAKRKFKRIEAEQIAAIVEKAEGKEYGGMFEAVIESMIEEREEAWAEGRTEGRIEIARNALEKGIAPDLVHDITGLDMETIQGLNKG